MKGFIRRFTWGFMPKGWGRLLFILMPLVLIFIYRIMDYIDYRDLLERISMSKNYIGSVGSFEKARPFNPNDLIECFLLSTGMSLIASWVADGFRKNN